jgi:hypothetical protein
VFIPYWLGGLTDHAVGTEDEEAVEGAGKPAVVGNREHGSLVGLQAVLEGLGRLQVKVIRRLIEQKGGRSLQFEQQNLEPRLLPAR